MKNIPTGYPGVTKISVDTLHAANGAMHVKIEGLLEALDRIERKLDWFHDCIEREDASWPGNVDTLRSFNSLREDL